MQLLLFCGEFYLYTHARLRMCVYVSDYYFRATNYSPRLHFICDQLRVFRETSGNKRRHGKLDGV